ncbi:MAG: TetR/AcrR family transcriptional regulator [Desulfatibacillaceae bacterium]
MNRDREPKRRYGGVRASQRMAERREKLLAAGLEAFGTTGYAQAGIKEICSLAGLTERYFYESFNNKEELLAAVYNGVVDELIGNAMTRLDRGRESRLDRAMDAVGVLFESVRDDPRKGRMLYFEILGVSDRIDREYHAATDRFIEIISLVLAGTFDSIDRAALESTVVPTGLAGALNLIAIKWILEDFSPPLADIMAQVRFLLESFNQFVDGTAPG